jgi:hypothetical protein
LILQLPYDIIVETGRLHSMLKVRIFQSCYDSRPSGAAGCYGQALDTLMAFSEKRRAKLLKGD